MVSSTSVLSLLWIGWLLSWLLASGWTTSALLFFRPRGGVLAAPLLRPRPWLGWIAVPIAALGFALTWWARIHLGHFWSAAVTLKAESTRSSALGRTGLTRHPIYTGLLLALLASALVRNSLAALLGIGLIALGLVLKLRQEEQFLLAQFGAAYAAYKKDVPAIIPGLCGDRSSG